MKTPSRITPEELCRQLVAWLEEHASDHGTHYHCKRCGGLLFSRQVSFSLHDAAFGEHCVGSGEVRRADLPFCPRCEAVPEDTGCLHCADLPLPTLVLQ